MTALKPPNLKDPFTVGFLLIFGFIMGICLHITLHDPSALCTPSLMCPPLAEHTPVCHPVTEGPATQALKK